MKALKGAKVYANHAKKSKIDVDDLRLAIKAILNNSFIVTPPREVLVSEALKFNAQPIPPLPPHPQVTLPEPRFCLGIHDQADSNPGELVDDSDSSQLSDDSSSDYSDNEDD